jgi:hypothetical protein
LAGAASQARAGSTTALADWCVNLNGETNTACNGAGSGGGIDLSAFDPTLEPSFNGLGSVVVNLVAGENNQYAAFYADYDLDYATYGSVDDFASTNGALPAGYSYDPNVSNIVGDFASDSLADTNTVGTASGPPDQCCDVAFALGLGGLDVAAGGTGTVTFALGTTAPASGFYIQQTNANAGDSIYLSAVADIQGPGTSTPEPSTLALGLGVLGVALGMARRKRVNA